MRLILEPRHEKTRYLHSENKDTDQLRGNREADQGLCFRYMDSTIPLLPKSEISSLQPSSVVVQPGLRRTWSETPKTGFLTMRLILYGWQQVVWKTKPAESLNETTYKYLYTYLLIFEPCHEKTCFLARLHEVQKSYCSHPGCTRSRSLSRSTLVKFSRSLYLGNHSSESIHTWTIGTQ